jgi:hypothetical protein
MDLEKDVLTKRKKKRKSDFFSFVLLDVINIPGYVVKRGAAFLLTSI